MLLFPFRSTFLLRVYTFKLTEVEFIKQSFLISKNKLSKWKLVFPTVKRTRAGTKRCYGIQFRSLFITEELERIGDLEK